MLFAPTRILLSSRSLLLGCSQVCLRMRRTLEKRALRGFWCCFHMCSKDNAHQQMTSCIFLLQTPSETKLDRLFEAKLRGKGSHRLKEAKTLLRNTAHEVLADMVAFRREPFCAVKFLASEIFSERWLEPVARQTPQIPCASFPASGRALIASEACELELMHDLPHANSMRPCD